MDVNENLMLPNLLRNGERRKLMNLYKSIATNYNYTVINYLLKSIRPHLISIL